MHTRRIADMDPRYDDVLLREDARGADAREMSRGSHYNYRVQAWAHGHDHAHCASGDESLPLLVCGADRVSCTVCDELLNALAAQ